MKTAISIPDAVFESADRLAQRLGVSRSELYARAVADYVAKHQHQAVTERLDQVYAAQPSRLDPDLRRAQVKSIRATEW
jgi:metal-responsive CopG/Arc/MetJ family transcriptional regulator